MKPLIFTLIIGTFLFSCTTQTNNIILGEKYSSFSKEPIKYNLLIKKDSTFIYTIGFSGSLVAKCKGKLAYNKTEDSIKLYCEKESLLESLTNTYMSERINSFKIIKKGKVLKNKNIILKN